MGAYAAQAQQTAPARSEELRQVELSTTPNQVYTQAQYPQLPGNHDANAIQAFVQQQLVYPPQAIHNGVAGKVWVNLTVSPTGRVSNIKVTHSLRADCDSAAVAAVRRLPPLVAAQQNGRAVYFNYSLPVTFQLPPANKR